MNSTSRDGERRRFQQQRCEADRQRKQRYKEALGRALALGFSPAQAPFAAMAFLTLTALEGPAPTRAMVQSRVRAQYPLLFEDKGEL